MPDGLVPEKNTLFFEHTAFVCDCFKSIKAWKTVVLEFVKHKHDILELIECRKRKEEKLLQYIHDKL